MNICKPSRPQQTLLHVMLVVTRCSCRFVSLWQMSFNRSIQQAEGGNGCQSHGHHSLALLQHIAQPQRSANAQSKLDHGLCVICLSSAEMATAILAIMPQGDR